MEFPVSAVYGRRCRIGDDVTYLVAYDIPPMTSTLHGNVRREIQMWAGGNEPTSPHVPNRIAQQARTPTACGPLALCSMSN